MTSDGSCRHAVFEAGKFGSGSKLDGVGLILLGIASIVGFWIFARPALREHRALKGGASMGRLIVGGPIGAIFIVLGIVLLFVGH